MARNDNEINEQIEGNDDLQRSMERGGIKVRNERPRDEAPIYKIINEHSKIPVSRHHGKIFKSRIRRGEKKRKERYEEKWQEAIRYYNADQSSHRSQNDRDEAQNIEVSEGSKRTNSQTENVVFANTSALVPAIYAKNPDVEITESVVHNEEYAKMAEKFINNMLKRRAFPRFNIRDAVRRSIVCTTITNVAYIEVGYTKRIEASQEALDQLTELADKLAQATDAKEIEKIEGQIMAIEHRVEFLRPAGPWHKFLSPLQVVRDPNNQEEALENDAWIAIWEYMPTNFLQAVYGTDKNGETRMLFKPSHVLPAEKNEGSSGQGRNSAEMEIDAYELLQEDSEMADFGYNDKQAYNDAKMTKVWRIWDKTTRRLYMYADNDWEWPIWVWHDPYNLVDFFPIKQLTFYTDPIEGIGQSEVSYYVDQQDELNEINSARREARRQAKFNVAYDKNKIHPKDVDAMLDSRRPRALGLDVPEGMRINDMIESIMPESLNYAELYDRSATYDAIFRISSVTAAMQGNEFRTNTTNKAIEFYNSTQATRLDEKIDAIENFIADLCWMMFQICVQFMEAEVAQRIIGPEYAEHWKTMQADELQERVGGLQVVGGSTQKPNTQAKQRMAIEVGQTLGQFSQAAPQLVLVLMRVMERAFDEVVINQEDWDFIKDAVSASVGTSEQQIEKHQQDPTLQGAGGPQNEQQMMRIIDALPMPAKEALARMILSGVPMEQAVQQIMQAIQTQMQQQGATPGAGSNGAGEPPQPQPQPQPRQQP